MTGSPINWRVAPMPNSRDHLEASLASFRRALDAAAQLRSSDQRAAALAFIGAVDQFIAEVPELAETPGAVIVLDLASGLADLSDGQVAPLMAPTVSGNRPPMIRQEKLVRAASHYCTDKIMGMGFSLERACRVVAKELTAGGYPIGGQPDVPPWQTIVNWRESISKKFPDDQERHMLEALRQEDPLNLEKGMSESEIRRQLRNFATIVYRPIAAMGPPEDDSDG
jgi:hypothetical protein